jgi:AcrR family transcriptional regulator
MSENNRSNDTRETLLATALSLFSESGYDATSVAQICEKAQVSKGAFYHHFPSKQDLFLSLMARWLSEMKTNFLSEATKAEDVPAALENMAAISGQIFSELDTGFPILLEFWRQASRDPLIWEQAVAPYEEYLAIFAAMIQTAKEEGSFSDGLDPHLAARVVTGLAMGLLLQASFDEGNVDWQQVTVKGIKILIEGMKRNL